MNVKSIVKWFCEMVIVKFQHEEGQELFVCYDLEKKQEPTIRRNN